MYVRLRTSWNDRRCRKSRLLSIHWGKVEIWSRYGVEVGKSIRDGPIGSIKWGYAEERKPSSIVSTNPSSWWSRWATLPNSKSINSSIVPWWEGLLGDGWKGGKSYSGGNPYILLDLWVTWLAMIKK